MKRSFDLLFALVFLLTTSPIIGLAALCIYLQDFKSPVYVAIRSGKGGRKFAMYKLRSMVINADSSGVDSTSTNDSRITKVGHVIRRLKLDETLQFINVLMGQMSVVGPRPNVPRETDLYTEVEEELLSVRPGITDYASIVFSDEGTILSGYDDPDLAYNQLIRPGKSRLGLFYCRNHNVFVDGCIVVFTFIALLSRQLSLALISRFLKYQGASLEICNLAARKSRLVPSPPPGSSKVVMSRDG